MKKQRLREFASAKKLGLVDFSESFFSGGFAEKELKEIIWNLPAPYSDEYKKIGEDLVVINRSILEATSRNKGSLRKLLDMIEEKMKLVKKIKDSAKEHALLREIDALWTELNATVTNVIKWVRGLVLELKKLEEAK